MRETRSPRPSLLVTGGKQGWRTQVDQLLQRKLSKGLGAGGAVQILARCLTWGRKCKESALLPVEGRRERQRGRLLQRKADEEQPQEDEALVPSLHERHLLLSSPVDLEKSTFGIFTDLLPEREVSTERSPTAEDPEREVFHLLCLLYNSSSAVRGFQQVYFKDPCYGQTLPLLQGRDQRELGSNTILHTLFRPIQENSSFEELLLRAAHLFAPANTALSELGLLSLHVHLKEKNKKLRCVHKYCPSCALTRGRRDRIDDRLKLTRKGPCNYLHRARNWCSGRKVIMVDIAGPLRLEESGGVSKIYCLLLLQQPLKVLHLRLLKDYSSEALYLCLLTFAQSQLEQLDVLVCDKGSQLNVVTDSALGFDEDLVELGKRTRKEWQRLALGQKRQRLTQQGIFIHMSQGRHSSISPIEQGVASLKYLLARYNAGLQTALDCFSWLHLFSLVEKACNSRPLAHSQTGRLYTPQDFLRLLEQGGALLDQPFLDPRPSTLDVVARFEELEQNLLELRRQLGPLLIEMVVEPALNLETIKEEKVKKRREQGEVTVGSIFFDPRLFQKTFHTTSSLLKLIKLGGSGRTGLFLKTSASKGRPDDLVTRGLETLHLVTVGEEDVVFGGPAWGPTFSFRQLLEKEDLKPNSQFHRPPPETIMKINPDSPDVESDIEELHKHLDQLSKTSEVEGEGVEEEDGPEGEDDRGLGEDEDGEEVEPLFLPPVRISSRGRLIKRPDRFGF